QLTKKLQIGQELSVNCDWRQGFFVSCEVVTCEFRGAAPTSDNFFSCFAVLRSDERKGSTTGGLSVGHFNKGTEMTLGQKLLLETLAGHIALLESAYPRKAKCAATRRAKQCVMAKLRHCQSRTRLAA